MQRPALLSILLLMACGADPIAPAPPSMQSVQPLWNTTLLTGASIAVDDAHLYAASAGDAVYVVSKSTGTLERTFANAGFTTSGGLAAVEGGLLVSGAQLRLLDRETGAVRWQYPVYREFEIPMLVNDSLAFVVGIDSVRHVHAVRLQSGTAKWATALRPPASVTLLPDDQRQVGGVSLRDDLVVVSHSLGSGAATRASFVTALDATTGAERWSAVLPVINTRTAAPAIGDNIVVVTDGLGNSYGLSRQSGALQWTSPSLPSASTFSVPTGGIAESVGAYAVTSEGYLGMSGLSFATGQKHWRALDVPMNPYTVLTVHPNGQLITANAFGELLGLDVGQSLSVRWRRPLPSSDRPRAVAIRGDTIFVTGSGGVRALVILP